MAIKERSQNPVIGNEVRLRLYTYNGNQRRNVVSINSVKLYFLDPNAVTDANEDGSTLFQTVETADVTHADTGEYYVTVNLEDPVYVIGRYLDVWEIEVEQDQPVATIEQKWKIYPDLWYTGPEPIVYDFNFGFRPNRLRSGEKRYLTVEVTPSVPNLPAMQRYYENLAAISPVKISMEMACGDCLPAEQDLRLVIDRDDVELRKANEGYYFIDTVELDLGCGIYNIWFEMEMGESKYISEKQQLEVFV